MSTAKSSESMASIMLKVPIKLKRRMDKVTKKGFRTRFIIDAIEKELKREELKNIADRIMNEKIQFTFKKVCRETSSGRLYNP